MTSYIEQKNDYIRRLVEHVYKVSYDKILSHTRDKELITPRKAMMFLMREYLGLSYPYIGRRLNRDHSTVIYGVRTFNADEFYERTGITKEELTSKLSGIWAQEKVNLDEI